MRLFLIVLTLVLTSYGCVEAKKNAAGDKIKLLKDVKLDIPEPSGIAVGKDNTLWIVSDKNEKIYNLNDKGEILDFYDTKIEDMEGVTVIDKSRLAVISEKKNKLYILDNRGKTLAEEKIKFKNKKNSGFEGLAWNDEEKVFYIVNEKNPGVLLTVDEKFDILSEQKLKYTQDYSGIYYHTGNDQFWIVSDESQTLIILDRDYKKLDEFEFNIPKLEGIAVNEKTDRMYLISDSRAELYIYDISGMKK